MIPSTPVIVQINALPVISRIASRKNNTVSDPKINCKAWVFFNVPKTMHRVNKPYMMK
jgi:hypothetical protein